jgi:DNA-binding transcriptional ArsR family regulator
MRRREFIAGLGSAAAWPLAARAQQAERMRRIGVLIGTFENDPNVKTYISAFTQTLADLGWIDGRNVRIDFSRLSVRHVSTFLFSGNSDHRLSEAACRILFWLLDALDQGDDAHEVYPSIPWLCWLTGMSHDTVERAVRNLENCGYVDVLRQKRKNHQYTVLEQPKFNRKAIRKAYLDAKAKRRFDTQKSPQDRNPSNAAGNLDTQNSRLRHAKSASNRHAKSAPIHLKNNPPESIACVADATLAVRRIQEGKKVDAILASQREGQGSGSVGGNQMAVTDMQTKELRRELGAIDRGLKTGTLTGLRQEAWRRYDELNAEYERRRASRQTKATKAQANGLAEGFESRRRSGFRPEDPGLPASAHRSGQVSRLLVCSSWCRRNQARLVGDLAQLGSYDR